MFTPTDFLNILKFFYDLKVLQEQGSSALPDTDLDPSTVITLLADQTKVKSFFENTIDQICFSTNDYKRLKSFFVDWYSSFRGIASTQKSASQVYSMPEEHLNELILSFGFEARSLIRVPKQNKVNLFFDLVNLYKIKGTPESLGRILQYYNLPNIEILEYWVQFNEEGDIVLRPSIAWSSELASYPLTDSNFFTIHLLDPHWFLTEDQIRTKLKSQYCSFPSKTPYIGVRPILYQYGEKQIIVSSVLSRAIHDEYDIWLATGVVPENEIDLTYFNINVSLLEAYLSYIYIFNKYYNRTVGGTGSNYLCYDGTSMTNISDVISAADNLIVRPTSRSDKKTKYTAYIDLFTRLLSDNFLSTATSAGEKLSYINPTLKNLLDTEYSINTVDDLLLTLLLDISYWVTEHVGGTYPNLANLVYGFANLPYIKDKINFFKPYRSRLIYTSSLYIINNPLENSFFQEDYVSVTHIETIVDWDTADSHPGYLEDFDPSGSFVTSTPVTPEDKQILDIYVDSTGTVKATYTDTPTNSTINVTSTPGIGQYRILSIYLEIDGIDTSMKVKYSDTPETIDGISTYIVSDPEAYGHYILDIYYNSLTQFTIVYDNNPVVWPIDSESRIYYSRNLYDCGGYFDLGASCDDPSYEPNINITEYIPDIYNYHFNATDSSTIVSIDWDTDSTSGEIIEIRTDGSWNEMDTGLVFDNPVMNDVCHIYIIGLVRYWVPGGNGIFSSSTNWSPVSGGPRGATYPNNSDYTAIFDDNSNVGHNTETVIIDVDVLCDITMNNDYTVFSIGNGGKLKLKNDFTICSIVVLENGIFSTNGHNLTVTTGLWIMNLSTVDISNSLIKLGLNLLSGQINSAYYTEVNSMLNNSGCNLEIYGPSEVYFYNTSVYDKVSFILDNDPIDCWGGIFSNTFNVIGSGNIGWM